MKRRPCSAGYCSLNAITLLAMLTPRPHPPNVAVIRRAEVATHLCFFERDVDPIGRREDGDGAMNIGQAPTLQCQERRQNYPKLLLVHLAVAAGSPRYAAAYASPPIRCAAASSAGHKANAAAAAPKASAAAAASASAAAAASASAAAAASASAAAAAASGKLHTGSECTDILFVEDIECRQANVRDFLFSENDFVARFDLLCRHVHCRTTGCTARERQRQPSSPQRWNSFPPSLSLRCLLRVRHGKDLPSLRGNARTNRAMVGKGAAERTSQRCDLPTHTFCYGNTVPIVWLSQCGVRAAGRCAYSRSWWNCRAVPPATAYPICTIPVSSMWRNAPRCR